MRRKLLVGVAVLSASLLHASAQVIDFTPKQPRQGQTISVTYNPAAPGAQLKDQPALYVVWSASTIDYGSSKQSWPMRRDGALWRADIPVEGTTAAITFFVVADDAWDSRASTSTVIYGNDGNPVRASLQTTMDPGNYVKPFEESRRLYPDDYVIYRWRWMMIKFAKEDAAEAIVEKELKPLLELDRTSLELTYARCYGWLALSNEPKARALLIEMLTEHPEAELTADAASQYDYAAYSNHWEGEGVEAVKAATIAASTKAPASPVARGQISGFIRDSAAPIETLEAIAEAWRRDVPLHPQPHALLAYAYSLRKIKLDRAADEASLAMSLAMSSSYRLIEDLSGSRGNSTVAWVAKTAAEIALARERYGDAVAMARMARSANDEGQAALLTLEAQAWRAAKQWTKAEDAYVDATLKGSVDARKALSEIYSQRHGSDTGFETWLSAQKSKRTTANAGSARSVAPAFKVTALDGKKYELSALKGKVVVLNFWGIGCAPCVREIPALNQLPKRYKGKNVVFLAIAGDDKDSLKPFLAKHPFDYQVVERGFKSTQAYGVDSFPQHVVIDKQGRIVARLSGGTDTRHEDLQPLIDEALSE